MPASLILAQFTPKPPNRQTLHSNFREGQGFFCCFCLSDILPASASANLITRNLTCSCPFFPFLPPSYGLLLPCLPHQKSPRFPGKGPPPTQNTQEKAFPTWPPTPTPTPAAPDPVTQQAHLRSLQVTDRPLVLFRLRETQQGPSKDPATIFYTRNTFVCSLAEPTFYLHTLYSTHTHPPPSTHFQYPANPQFQSAAAALSRVWTLGAPKSPPAKPLTNCGFLRTLQTLLTLNHLKIFNLSSPY